MRASWAASVWGA